MRKFLTAAAIALAALTVPSTAGAALVHAESAAAGRGHVLRWTLDYDTVTDDLTVNVTHTKFDGSPAVGQPQEATIVLVRPNGTERPFDLLTIRPPGGGAQNILNDGPLTYPSFATRVSANRANLIEFRTEYTPPLGT